MHKINAWKTIIKHKRHERLVHQKPLNFSLTSLKQLNLMQEIGIPFKSYVMIFKAIEMDMKNSKHRSKETRIFSLLNWLRNGASVNYFHRFQISPSTLSKDKRELIPLLFSEYSISLQLLLIFFVGRLRIIQYFQLSRFHIDRCFTGVEKYYTASIDCTNFNRYRVHPGQAQYYRGDKHAHFILGQFTVDQSGLILDVSLFKGHNNDLGFVIEFFLFLLLIILKSAFNRSKMVEILHEKNLILLGDGGYNNCRILNPAMADVHGCNMEQQVRRSIVEIIIGVVQNWKVANEKWKSPSIELQVQSILVCCELAQLRLLFSPQAPNFLSPESRRILKGLSRSILTLSPELVFEKLKYVQKLEVKK